MTWLFVFQRLVLEFILDFLLFPFWWYTVGAKRALTYCFNFFRSGNELLAPGLWLKNIFVPMFGQTDWQGRLVSFFMRLGNVIGRTIALLVWLILALALLSLWLAIPVFVFYMLVISF